MPPALTYIFHSETQLYLLEHLEQLLSFRNEKSFLQGMTWCGVGGEPCSGLLGHGAFKLCCIDCSL